MSGKKKKKNIKELTPSELHRLTEKYRDKNDMSPVQAVIFEVIEWSVYALIVFVLLKVSASLWWPPLAAMWNGVSKLF